MWVDVAVVAAIVGAGVVFAGFTNTSSSIDLAIAGCEEVVSEEDLVRINYAFTTGSDVARTDDPWITDSKLNRMTEALVGALPAEADVEPDSSTSRLEFSGGRETYSVAGSTIEAPTSHRARASLGLSISASPPRTAPSSISRIAGIPDGSSPLHRMKRESK
ncbi:hypothetical protein ACFULT_10035 [Rhodococcus sp. NPDC057297]|uniref:hypothetical protein n=1 Tax=Rhodococcus sp. NPDC057297 TaxID=3346090 RepID=UPI0036334D6A